MYILASDLFQSDDKYVFRNINFLLFVGNFEPFNTHIFIFEFVCAGTGF